MVGGIFYKIIDKTEFWLYACISTVIQRRDILAWKFTSDRPVYLQITERIIKSVLSGEYKPGEQIPSVRQLALEAAVNPNTVQHAFAELESEGIVVSRGTLGRFVTEDNNVIESSRKTFAEKIVKDFVININDLSITKAQAIEMIEEVFK